jgi:uroporphyrinogen-III synthase
LPFHTVDVERKLAELDNKIIALPETRELDLFARMFENRGATALRCPLVGIRDATDAAPIEAWLARFIAGEMGDLILMTGEGLRRLLGFADRAGLRGDFIAALARVRKITRGPKPQRALREIGLAADLAAVEATTDGVMASLRNLDLSGRRIGLQLYGEEPIERLQIFLRGKGAAVDAVAPYRYVDACDDADVIALIDRIASGTVDAIAFTSAPQVRRMREVAAYHGRQEVFIAGLQRMVVAAIGPIVAKELASLEVNQPVMPESSFNMKPLANAILLALQTRSPARR